MLLAQDKPEPRSPTGVFSPAVHEVVIYRGDTPYTHTDEPVVICDSSGGAITINLRDIDEARGSTYQFINIGDNNVTVTPKGNDTIMGLSSFIVPENGAVKIYAPIHDVDDWKFTQDYRLIIDTTNVSDPPTDAELDAAFGTPADLGPGYVRVLDDNSADTDVWLVWTSDTSWYYLQGTKAT